MDPFEITNFSLISKRTKAVTKQTTFYPNCLVKLNITKEPEVSIQGTKDAVLCTYVLTSNEKQYEEMCGKLEEEDDCYDEIFMWKYSDNVVEECKQLSKHVLEIFKKQTNNRLAMTMDEFVDHNVSIIDFLRTNVKSVNECNLYHSEKENDVDEHTAYLLNNLKINNEFCSLLHIKNDNFDGKIPKNLNELYMFNSQSLGYEKLLKIDCEHVTLRNDRITNEEWSMFLKKWIAMETHLNLECLKLKFKSIEELKNCVLHDIPYEMVDEEVKRTLIT